MAIYSFSGQIISRGKSIKMNADGSTGAKASSRRSTSVAAAAYRSGTRLVDERTGHAYDYTRKGGVVFTEIMLPDNAPGRYHDRQTLWNAVEAAEKQVNSQLARELRVALPCEFSREENIVLLREYVKKNFVARGMIADIAYHVKDKAGEDHNPHAHIMLTMRPMTKSGVWWQTKSRKEYLTDRNGNRIVNANGEYKTRNIDLTGWNDKTLYIGWREAWAQACNSRFAEKGLSCRIDHRSYIEQGVERIPARHLGKEAAALERKGVSTEKGNYNRAVAAYNEVNELGIDANGLYATLQGVFLKVRERQRLSKKARISEPALESAGTAQEPERAERFAEESAGEARSAQSAGRNDQRRTDAPLHGAVRQGEPLHPEDESTPPFGAKKKPLSRLETPDAAAAGGRSSAQDKDAMRRSAAARNGIRHAAGTNNFMAERGIKSYGELLAGARKAQAEYDAAAVLYNFCQDKINALRKLEECARWCSENRGVAAELNRLKTQSADFYRENRSAILKVSYAQKQLTAAGFAADASPEAIREKIQAISLQRNGMTAAAKAELERLQKLRKSAHWCREYRAVSEQFDNLKLFRGRFYQNHKNEIDRFNYGKAQLEAAGYNNHVIPESFEQSMDELNRKTESAIKKFNTEIDVLEKLEYAARQRDENSVTAQRYEASRQLTDDFYKLHQKELGRFYYGEKGLKSAGFTAETSPEAFRARTSKLAQQRNMDFHKLEELKDEMRMWLSCEKYMRDLLDIPEPDGLKNFSVAEKTPHKETISEKLQRISDMERERKNKPKAPEQKHRRDDRGR